MANNKNSYLILRKYQFWDDKSPIYHLGERNKNKDLVHVGAKVIIERVKHSIYAIIDISYLAYFNKLIRPKYDLRHPPITFESLKVQKPFHWKIDFYEQKDGFDIIIGNPPYRKVKSDEIVKHSEDFKLLSSGVVNTASLFIKRSLNLLKNNGYLSFIIPKSFTNVESWRPIRNVVMEKALKSVSDVSVAFKEVGLEQVVLVIRKSIGSPSDRVRILKEDKEINVLDLKFFIERGVILTALTPEKRLIIEKIESGSRSLGEFAEMPRGVTINKSEYKTNSTKVTVQVLGGTNVERYRIKEGTKRKQNRYLDANDKRVRSNQIFEEGRIIYHNIPSSVPKIVATIDPIGSPTDDTLNNIIMNDDGLNTKYLLAILNSKLATFYLRYAIINCSILTIHLDKPYLGKIPIKRIPIEKQQQFIDLVDKLLGNPNGSNDKTTKKINETEINIDNLVYDLYGIKTDWREVIENDVK